MFHQRRGVAIPGHFAMVLLAAAAPLCALALVANADGLQLLCFDAKGGAAACGGFRFGQFPDVGRLQFQPGFGSDERTPDSDRFYVRTADGGMASVRIVERGWPKTVIQYVWLPKR
jgi:hypothetical protein